MKLNSARQRALEALPSEGQWIFEPTGLGAALASLAKTGLCERGVGVFRWNWRLTESGVAAKAGTTENSN